MARRSILLFIFFIAVAVRSINANCEGEYTTNVSQILQEMDEDDDIISSETRTLEQMFVMEDAGLFKNICNDCDQRQKLSICMKVLQHKWKILRPISFTVNPSETDYECLSRDFYGRNDKICSQPMYLCPKTIMRFFGLDNTVRSSTQPPFLIGQSSHDTLYRVRVFKRDDPASVEGQLTGFSLNQLRFRINNRGRYKYTPVYERSNNIELVCVIVPVRGSTDVAEYRFERPDYSTSDSCSSDSDDFPDDITALYTPTRR